MNSWAASSATNSTQTLSWPIWVPTSAPTLTQAPNQLKTYSTNKPRIDKSAFHCGNQQLRLNAIIEDLGIVFLGFLSPKIVANPPEIVSKRKGDKFNLVSKLGSGNTDEDDLGFSECYLNKIESLETDCRRFLFSWDDWKIRGISHWTSIRVGTRKTGNFLHFYFHQNSTSAGTWFPLKIRQFP